MSVTPETLPRHELVGLHVEVTESTDPGRLGIAGEVVDETRQTLEIAPAGASRTVQVPKAESAFTFTLTGPEGEPVAVRVQGTRLVADPARRTETRGESPWR